MSLFARLPDVTSTVRGALASFLGSNTNRLTGQAPSKPQVLSMLQSRAPEEQLKALKFILAQYFGRRDVGEYLSHVANLITSSYEVKKLAYFFLNAIGNAHKREVLMCINSFHKETSDKQPLVRATALRALTGLRLSEIVELLFVTVQKATNDFSIYVRKTAALNIMKLSEVEESLLPQLSELLSKVLKDPYMLVVGPAVLVLHILFPNRLDLLHPHYRRICRGLSNFEDWYIPTTLTVLLRYARTYLDKRLVGIETTDPDLKLLLDNVEPLFNSSSPSVLLAAANVFYHLAPEARYRAAAHSLLTFRSTKAEIAELMLDMIHAFASKMPEVYSGFHSFFYLSGRDTLAVARQKIDILTLLITEGNALYVLRELMVYAHMENLDIATLSISALGVCAQKPAFSEACTKHLVSLLKSQRSGVISQCIIVLRGLIALSPDKYHKVIVHCAKYLDTLESSTARASAIWIVGAYNVTPK